MTRAVLYGTGSALIVDFEESLRRAGIFLAAGVRNREGTCWLGDQSVGIRVEELTEDLLRLPFLVPLFVPSNRRTAWMEASERGFLHPLTLTDPTAVVPSSLRLGLGSYVAAGTTMGAMSTLGACSLINRGACLGHHFQSGEFVSIGPGAVVAGLVTVGSGTLIGAGAVLLPKVTVGSGCVVAAGAVVTRDVPDCCLVVGSPARIVRTDLPAWENVSPSGDPLVT